MSDWIDKVHALADGELSEAEMAEAQHLVASDPKAAAELEWAVLFKNHLGEKLPPVKDDETWQKCQARFDAIDKTSKTEAFVGKYAWAFCLIFLVGIFSAYIVNKVGGSRPLSNDHVAGLFNGLTPFNFTESRQALDSVKSNVGPAPLQVIGVARVTSLAIGYVDGRRTANLTLNDGHGPVSLFVIKDTSGIDGLDVRDSGYQCGTINESRAVSWTDSGYLFLLLGPRPHEELLRLADQFRTSR